MTLSTETITGGARLRAIEPAWWKLWRNADATPFQSPAWLLPWWDAFAPGELLVVAIWHGEDLAALAPFYRDDAGIARPIGISLSDYLDVLIDPAFAPEAADALQAEVAQRLATDIAVWEFHDLKPDASALCLALDAQGEVSDGEPCPVLIRSDSCGTLTGAIPTRKRRKLRMAQHRAERSGGSTIVAVRGADIEQAFDALITLHNQRWSEDGGGVLKDPRTLALHRAALPLLDNAGLLDMYVCKADEEIAGVYYGLRDATRAYAYLGGFDPQQAAVSPGSRLIDHAITQACAAGCHEFHFLRGGESYKYEWGAIDRVNRRRILRAPADAHA